MFAFQEIEGNSNVQDLLVYLQFILSFFFLNGIWKMRQFITLSQEGIQPQLWALQDVLNDSFVCYQGLSEYVGL